MGAMAYVRMRILDRLRVLCKDLKRWIEVDTGGGIINIKEVSANDFKTPKYSSFDPA